MCMLDEKLVDLDASTFQRQLETVAEVLAQKARREAPKLLSAPAYVAEDLHVLVRQAIYTYNLLFYLNADERRETDPHWRNAYSIVTLPLIRNLIDSLYNVTAILQNASTNGPWFRKSGYKRSLEALDLDEERYAGKPEWDEWVRKNRETIDFCIRNDHFNKADVMATTTWPTMGTYVSRLKSGGTITPHQAFLKTFAYGRWREYSAMAHGSFEGLLITATFYIRDLMPHEEREKMDQTHPRILFMHIARAAGVLLCIVTELQSYFRFDDDGARINERIHEVWKALMPVPEIKELFDERYDHLMRDRGIQP
jgi:hypothetical protein